MIFEAPLVGPLGVSHSKTDSRTIKLAQVAVRRPLRAPPSKAIWGVLPTGGVVKRGEAYGNTEIGNCVFAEWGGVDETVCAHTGAPRKVTRDVAIQGYSDYTNYDRATGKGDDGSSMYDGIKWAKAIGLIDAFAQIETGDAVQCKAEIELAVHLTMSAQLSVAMPIAWQSRKVWDSAPAQGRDRTWEYGSWGGHAISVIDYDQRGLWVFTWGGVKFMTWEGYLSYRKSDAYVGFHHALARMPDGSPTPCGLYASEIKRILAGL